MPATFNNYDPGMFARQSQISAMRTGMFIAHKDWTKPLARPNTIQEIVNETESNAQYCVRLGVPAGATNVSLYWLHQYTLSASTASVNSISCNLAGTSLAYWIRVYGRIPTLASPYAYGAADAGLSGAVAVDPAYGMWRSLMSYKLNVGGANEMVSLNGDNVSGLQYEVSSTVRTLLSPFIIGGSGYIISSAQNGLSSRVMPVVSTTDATPHDPMNGTIALRGATELLIVPEYSNTFTSATFSNSTSGGTTTVDWSAIAACFHS